MAVKKIGIGSIDVDVQKGQQAGQRKKYVQDAKGKTELVQHGQAADYLMPLKQQDEAQSMRSQARKLEKQADRGFMGSLSELAIEAAAMAFAPMTGGLSMWIPRLLSGAQMAGADIWGVGEVKQDPNQSLRMKSAEAATGFEGTAATKLGGTEYTGAQQRLADAHQEVADVGKKTKLVNYGKMALQAGRAGTEAFAAATTPTFTPGDTPLAEGVAGPVRPEVFQTPMGAGVEKMGLGDTSFGNYLSNLGVDADSMAAAKLQYVKDMTMMDKLGNITNTAIQSPAIPMSQQIFQQQPMAYQGMELLDPRRSKRFGGWASPMETNTQQHMGGWRPTVA